MISSAEPRLRAACWLPTGVHRQHRWFALVLFSAALIAGCGGHQTSSSEPAPYAVEGDRVELSHNGPSWKYVKLATAEMAAPIPPEPVPARVAFDEGRSVPVVAPLAGRVDTVAIRLGQHVEQGDRLIAVRSGKLVDLFREIEILKAKETAAAKTTDRLHALVQLKASPEKELIEAEQALSQARLAREAAEAKLRSMAVAGEQQGLYWLTAPRAGVVVERSVLVGQEAGPERSEPLLVIADLDEVIVTADVSEADIGSLQVGQPASVRATSGHGPDKEGQIEYIGQVVDPVRRMVEVRVRVRNDDPNELLRPNAFTRVTFPPPGGLRVVTPARAVVTDDDRSYVFVQLPAQPDSLQRREVTVGRQGHGLVEIASGLQPGETYVVEGAILLLNSIDIAS